MFGDDLNSTVMTERVGFRVGFRRAREGGLVVTVKREAKTRLVWNGQRGQGDPREGDEGKREKRQRRTNASFKKTMPMQCE